MASERRANIRHGQPQIAQVLTGVDVLAQEVAPVDATAILHPSGLMGHK